MASKEAATETGSRVRFSARSVFLPNPEEAVNFAGNDELEGIITGFSDSGASLKAYAVVEVVRKLSLVVPIQELRLVSDREPNAAELGS